MEQISIFHREIVRLVIVNSVNGGHGSDCGIMTSTLCDGFNRSTGSTVPYNHAPLAK